MSHETTKPQDLLAVFETPAPALSTLVREVAELGSVDEVLSRLTPEQLAALGKAAFVGELRDAVGKKIKVARIDYAREREAWLATYRSTETRRAYTRALAELEAWATRNGLDVLALDTAAADLFLASARGRAKADGKTRDADSIRAVAHAIGAFFRYVSRHHADIHNPFKGSFELPKKTLPHAVIPTPGEVQTMIQAATDATLVAALRVLAETGIRIGGLRELAVRPDGQYSTQSKGKAVKSPAPLAPETVKLLAPLGSRPFAGLSVDVLRMRINRHIADLHRAGRISVRYSPHDLRHFFAEQHKGRGLYWLARALGHSTVGVTEQYLRNSLGVDPREIEAGLPE